MYQTIQRLPPASFLEFNASDLKIHQYWSADVPPPSYVPQFVEAKEQTAKLLRAAVNRHLVADVPVGVCLSGGLDSSLIAAFAAMQQGSQLRTYSIEFDYARNESELGLARMVAQKFQTEHHEILVSAKNVWGALEELAYHHDEPFADAANIPLYLLSQKISGETKVVLQGDGGDEIFGGYSRYRLARIWAIARSVSAFAYPIARPFARHSHLLRVHRVLHALTRPQLFEAIALLLTVEQPVRSPLRVLTAAMQAEISVCDPFRRYREVVGGLATEDISNLFMKTDTQIILPSTFLEKVDKSTMANSIEVRVPMLDNDLTDFALGLPSALKVGFGMSKRLLRAVATDVLPAQLVTAPKKGFGVPYEKWLRGPMAPQFLELLRESRERTKEIFDHDGVERVLAEHVAGRENNGFLLWKVMTFLLWARKYDKVTF